MPEAVAPAPANGAPRNNAGQFSPKAGATGVVPQGETSGTGTPAAGATSGTPPPSGPQSVEDWSLEGEVDVYGEKQKVSYKSKAEVLRDLQVAKALQKRVRDIQEAERRIQERERQPQLTPQQQEAQFRQQVIERAKLAEMTPVERELAQAKAQLAQFQRMQEEARRAEQQRIQAEQRRQLSQRAVSEMEEAAQLSSLPYTHATMALMAEIQEEATSQGLPPLPPDLLAAEANKRYNERGVEPLKKLQGKALLDRLGGDVVRAVLMAERERRGLAAGQRQPMSQQPSSRELPAPTDEKVYGEAEAAELLRQMRNSRR